MDLSVMLFLVLGLKLRTSKPNMQDAAGTEPELEIGTVVFFRNRRRNQNRWNLFSETETETGTEPLCPN